MSAVTLDVERIAAGGAGVARLPDGRAVFVHRTAPGDRVEARVTREKRSWARARLVRVLRPGPGRRRAPCPYYDRCGGCTLEHLHYQSQLRTKAELVRDALHRIGGVSGGLPEVVASPRELRYRNRVSFTLRRLGGRVVAGFHELERPGRVFDVDGACLLPEARLGAAWDALRQAWGEGARRLPSGDRLRLTLRAGLGGEASLLVEGGRGRGAPEELLRDVPGLVSVWQRPAPGAPLRLLAGREDLEEEWAGARLSLRGDVFLQVNREAAALLEDHVARLAGAVGGMRVVDAYCGIGAHARRLARAGAEVVGVERSAAAVAEAGRLGGGPTYLTGAVEAHVPGLLPADLALVNPPRAGLSEPVVGALLERPAARVIYVSCDPATLARDASRLGSRYRLRSVRCFDLFPQTAHVETVAEFTCATT